MKRPMEEQSNTTKPNSNIGERKINVAKPSDACSMSDAELSFYIFPPSRGYTGEGRT